MLNLNIVMKHSLIELHKFHLNGYDHRGYLDSSCCSIFAFLVTFSEAIRVYWNERTDDLCMPEPTV